MGICMLDVAIMMNAHDALLLLKILCLKKCYDSMTNTRETFVSNSSNTWQRFGKHRAVIIGISEQGTCMF